MTQGTFPFPVTAARFFFLFLASLPSGFIFDAASLLNDHLTMYTVEAGSVVRSTKREGKEALWGGRKGMGVLR